MKRVFIVIALVIFALCFVLQAQELHSRAIEVFLTSSVIFILSVIKGYDELSELCLITHLVSKR